MSVIFLDIDGVMLPGRAYALPENLRRQKLLGTPGHTGELLDCLPVDFDPVAVALVGRLADVAGARLVLHSDWRRHYDKDVLHGHLLRQGLGAGIFHADWWLDAPFGQRKREAISAWLDAHVPEPLWCALDDDAIFRPAKDLSCAKTRRRLKAFAKRHVQVDGEVGITLADYYRRALALLGHADPDLETKRLRR